MKRKESENQDKLLHHLLDAANIEPETSLSEGLDADRLTLYRESLKDLENHEERVPDGFASRVMAALPDKPRHTWGDKLKSFWPERRFWAVPAISGALAMLMIMAGITLFRSTPNTLLIPVVLDLYAPSAKQVELVGTFSNWMPKAFRLKGPDATGYWAIAVKLPPGRYEYAFMINGSQIVPDDDGEGLRPDGFGHENSLLLLKKDEWPFDQRYQFTAGEYLTIPGNEPKGQMFYPSNRNRELWQALLDRGIAAGVQKQTIENLLSHLASANMSPDEARNMLEPLFQDFQAGHPTRDIFLKIHECILKRALPETLKAIAERRHEAFKNARAMLVQTGYSTSMNTYPALVNATAFALESGQDPAFLRVILSAGKGKSSEQITAVIEAGEILYYAGLEPEILKAIIEDCLRRGLKGLQVERVTEQVQESIRKGTDHRTIRNKLWI